MRGVLLALVGGLLIAGAAAAQGPAPEPPGANLMPAGEGRAEVVRTCSGCHALEIVAQQRLDPNGWADLVQMMRDRGAQGSDEDMAKIVAYLSKTFPAGH